MVGAVLLDQHPDGGGHGARVDAVELHRPRALVGVVLVISRIDSSLRSTSAREVTISLTKMPSPPAAASCSRHSRR